MDKMVRTRIVKGKRTKVEQYGAQHIIYDGLKEGLPITAITEKIVKEKGPIDYQSVKKFIKNSQSAQNAVIRKDLHEAAEYKQMYMDYDKKLKDILKDVEEMKTLSKSQQDLASYSSLIGRLLQGIELFAKLAGKLGQPGQIDINILYEDIGRKISFENVDKKRTLLGKGIDIKFIVDAEDNENAKRLKKEYGDDEEIIDV